MDFKMNYSGEQDAFRAVVRAWLEQHVPRDLNIPPDGSPLSTETQDPALVIVCQLTGNRFFLDCNKR